MLLYLGLITQLPLIQAFLAACCGAYARFTEARAAADRRLPCRLVAVEPGLGSHQE